jgi:hypothetical protein
MSTIALAILNSRSPLKLSNIDNKKFCEMVLSKTESTTIFCILHKIGQTLFPLRWDKLIASNFTQHPGLARRASKLPDPYVEAMADSLLMEAEDTFLDLPKRIDGFVILQMMERLNEIHRKQYTQPVESQFLTAAENGDLLTFATILKTKKFSTPINDVIEIALTKAHHTGNEEIINLCLGNSETREITQRFLERITTRPINQLVLTDEEISDDDLEVRLQSTSRDELLKFFAISMGKRLPFRIRMLASKHCQETIFTKEFISTTLTKAIKENKIETIVILLGNLTPESIRLGLQAANEDGNIQAMDILITSIISNKADGKFPEITEEELTSLIGNLENLKTRNNLLNEAIQYNSMEKLEEALEHNNIPLNYINMVVHYRHDNPDMIKKLLEYISSNNYDHPLTQRSGSLITPLLKLLCSSDIELDEELIGHINNLKNKIFDSLEYECIDYTLLKTLASKVTS